MQITTADRDNVTIAMLEGHLDFASSQRASEELTKLVESSDKLIIDMSGCQYVSSSGLRVLLLVGKRVKQLDDRAVLCSLTDDVKEIMEMTGFGSIFKCFDDVDTALGYINSAASA